MIEFMARRAYNADYMRKYRERNKDPRYGTPEYNAKQAERVRERRANDPAGYRREIARLRRRRRERSIRRMGEEIARVS